MNASEIFRIQVATKVPFLRTWVNKFSVKRENDAICEFVVLKGDHIDLLGLKWEYVQQDENTWWLFTVLGQRLLRGKLHHEKGMKTTGDIRERRIVDAYWELVAYMDSGVILAVNEKSEFTSNTLTCELHKLAFQVTAANSKNVQVPEIDKKINKILSEIKPNEKELVEIIQSEMKKKRQ